jgi:hypothetical protein
LSSQVGQRRNGEKQHDESQMFHARTSGARLFQNFAEKVEKKQYS